MGRYVLAITLMEERERVFLIVSLGLMEEKV